MADDEVGGAVINKPIGLVIDAALSSCGNRLGRMFMHCKPAIFGRAFPIILLVPLLLASVGSVHAKQVGTEQHKTQLYKTPLRGPIKLPGDVVIYRAYAWGEISINCYPITQPQYRSTIDWKIWVTKTNSPGGSPLVLPAVTLNYSYENTGGSVTGTRTSSVENTKQLGYGLAPDKWRAVGGLGRLPFVGSGADEVQRRVPSDGIVETIDITADGSFGVCTGHEDGPPDEFGFQGFEECLDDGVVVAIAFAGHGDQRSV